MGERGDVVVVIRGRHTGTRGDARSLLNRSTRRYTRLVWVLRLPGSKARTFP